MKNLSASKNYQNAPVRSGGSSQIPPGGYVCVVKNVKMIDNSAKGWNDQLAIAIDVVEGELKGFFEKRFKADTSENRKWKGVYRLRVPLDDGSEQDGWTQSSFKTAMNNFEQSNKGFVWDWDENKLKGLLIGIVFGTTETEINGRDVSYSEARFTITVDDVRNGNIPEAKKKTKKNNTASSSDGFVPVADSDDDMIPFLP